MFKRMLLCTLLLSSIGMSATFAEEPQLANSVDDFSWKYFKTLNKDENIFYSPYSIGTALNIVANGAEGQTCGEMLQVLSIDSLEDINRSYKNFHNIIEKNYNGNGLTLMDSNLILINSKYAVNGINKNYQSIVENIYKSTIRDADFIGNLEGEKQKISEWVNDKTNRFIPNYRSIATTETVMDILNVIYFKGDWNMPFKVAYTKPETFTNKDGSKSDVDMMNKSFKNEIKYHEDGKYKAIALPYKKLNGIGIATMYLILPIKSSNLDIADEWSSESTEYKQTFLKNLRTSPTFYGKVYVKLPKFELDIENLIVNNLKAMGIKRAFTNDAEFFKMVNNVPLKIDNVNHRAKIKVDETGTEAAAVTEVVMVDTTSAMPEPEIIKNFYADRPFMFIIGDVESNIDLFVGVVNKM